MRQLTYLNEQGEFTLRDAQRYGEIYFPLVSEGEMISSVTPLLAGDCKTGQNTFLLAPASETACAPAGTAVISGCGPTGGEPWSVTGQSAPQQARRFAPDWEETVLTAGLLWQRITRENRALGLRASTLTFDERGHRPGRVTYRVWGGDETGVPPQGFLALAKDFVGEGSWDWPEAVVHPRPDTWLHAGQSAQPADKKNDFNRSHICSKDSAIPVVSCCLMAAATSGSRLFISKKETPPSHSDTLLMKMLFCSASMFPRHHSRKRVS